MAFNSPVVLETNSIGSLIQHVLNHHAPPSTLVICSSKEAFLEALKTESSTDQENTTTAWTTPTFRLLSTARTLTLAFVPDITHLRAYLATYSTTVSKRDQAEKDTALRLPGAAPILAILNPIQLHRPTSAFSAQGLNRTFAAAIEAAHHTSSKLILAECPPPAEPILDAQDNELRQPSSDPWTEDVPILNVTTKRLGELSVGRTVKIKDIAVRWCTFEKLESLHS